MKNILFLCTGNSCRSQMAEGLARHYFPDSYHFYSAGTKKHGMNPYAVRAMKSMGIDISQQKSKLTSEITEVHFDYVFTVCSDAHENCPYHHGEEIIHVGFDDPPKMTQGLTDDKQIMQAYENVRDEIKAFILNLEEYIK